MQVTNVNPLTKKTSDSQSMMDDLGEPFKDILVYSDIFAIGDITLTSENEEKAVIPINL